MDYDVVLVVSPFAKLNGPKVGPSVLVPQLRKKGISAKVYYANIVLASEIGAPAYGRLTDLDTSGVGMIGEALFGHWARRHDLGPADADQEIAKMLEIWERREPTVGATPVNPKVQPLRHEIVLCLDAIPGFLDRACADILSYSPKVIGFSSSDPQLASPIALARRLKAETPDLITVLGGSNATTPMGEAIRKASGVFDFVFSGEADFVFPQFVERYLREGTLPSTNPIECPPVPHLDDVSVPDYDDYFEQMRRTFPPKDAGKDLVEEILFEASRGCWWGMMNPCTFCGLDSPSSPFRHKSPERVIEEIRTLSQRYGIGRLRAVDVAFPKEYFKTLLPKLAAQDDNNLDLNLTVRADLRSDDLDAMKRAGVTCIMCGIESLSTVLLKMMNKGVTAQQNLCLLRDCRSQGILVEYSLLIGVPGEDPEEYRAMINLIPKLEHLQPPHFLPTMKVFRSSAYFSQPEEYGIIDINPSPVYRLIFGDEADFANIAYTFQATLPSEFLKDHSLREAFSAAVNTWRSSWQPQKKLPVLRKVSVLTGIHAVQDTRKCAVQEFYLPDDEEFELLDYLMTPRRRADVTNRLEGSLDNLLRRHYVVDYEGLLVSLVNHPYLPSGMRRSYGAV